MPNRRNLSRLAIVSLVAAAISAPAASAAPADPVTTTDPATAPAYPTPTAKSEQSAAQQDMHASTVHKPAPTGQDLRGEYAKDPSTAPQTKAPVGVNARRPLPGPPVFPTTTDALSPPKQTVTTTDGDGGDIEWPIAAISLAAALLIGGGLGAAAHRTRASARPAH